MKLSFNAISYYGKKSLPSIFGWIKDCGYDALELPYVPESHPFFAGETYTKEAVLDASKRAELPVSSICPFYPANLDLASNDEKTRMAGVDYVKKMVDLAAGVGATVVVVVPSAVFKPNPGTFDEEWKYSLASLRQLAPYAASAGITLALEPINRFLTTFINTIEQATDLAESAGPGVALMGDLFHMNIEESDLQSSLLQAGELLAHMHVSDSNNGLIGTGHLNVLPVLRTLETMNYSGYLTVEAFVPDIEIDTMTSQMAPVLRALTGGFTGIR